MTTLVAAFALAIAWLLMTGHRQTLRARLPRALAHPRVPHSAMRWWRDRGVVARRDGAVVEVVFALAAELRAGRPPGRALALVADTAPTLQAPLTEAAVAVDAGASPSEELRRVSALPGCGGLLGVAAAWTVTESAGGAIADVLDRLGEVLDAESQSKAALAAALAAPRATMTLLAGLPLLGIVLGQSLGAHPVQLFLHRPLGWALLAVGAVLDLVGVVWTRLLVRRALR